MLWLNANWDRGSPERPNCGRSADVIGAAIRKDAQRETQAAVVEDAENRRF
jgi:glutaredoxin-related protein